MSHGSHIVDKDIYWLHKTYFSSGKSDNMIINIYIGMIFDDSMNLKSTKKVQSDCYLPVKNFCWKSPQQIIGFILLQSLWTFLSQIAEDQVNMELCENYGIAESVLKIFNFPPSKTISKWENSLGKCSWHISSWKKCPSLETCDFPHSKTSSKGANSLGKRSWHNFQLEKMPFQSLSM